MSHRQRATHTAHFHREVDTGEDNRDGSDKMSFTAEGSHYATAGVRLTDEGQPIAQGVAGVYVAEEPIIACNRGGLLSADPPVQEGHRVALEGPTTPYDESNPNAEAWFRITQVTELYGRTRTPRGFEAMIQETSEYG